MLGEFMYCNPTRLYFGKESLGALREELISTVLRYCCAMEAAPLRKMESTIR